MTGHPQATTVLVTRPELLARPLCARLKELGYTPWLEPLLNVKIIETPRPVVPQNVIVVLSSRTTLAALEGRKAEVSDLFHRPCYCVGNRTAAVAQQYGFRDVRCGAANGESLAHFIINHEDSPCDVIHIGGDDQSVEPDHLLKEHGFNILNWIVYKADLIETFTESCQQDLKRGLIGTVLFFSPRTTKAFVQCVKAAGLESACAHITAVGLSKNVVSPLQGFPVARLATADEPTEESLIECLCRTVPFC